MMKAKSSLSFYSLLLLIVVIGTIEGMTSPVSQIIKLTPEALYREMNAIIKNKEKYPSPAYETAQKWMSLWEKYKNAKAWPKKLPRSMTANTATLKMKEFLNEADLLWGSSFDFKYIFALLRAGANPNVSNDQGVTVLGAAIVLAIMWDKPAYVRNIKKLLEYGANPNIKTTLTSPEAEGLVTYPLSVAINIGYAFDIGSNRRILTNRILDLLLKKGANIKFTQDRSGESFDQVASDYFSALIMLGASSDEFERFILHGVDVNEPSYANMTPLQQAVFFKNINAVKILLRHGADVKLKGKKGKTPLELAQLRYKSKDKNPDEIEIITILEKANKK